MNIGELCTRAVIFVDRNESVRQAAELMRQHHVGDLVVIDASSAYRAPIGMVTDRDIAVEVVALGVDPGGIKAADIMSRRLVVARESESQSEVAQRMRDAGVRRIPVVAADGTLVGILSMDDLLEAVTDELSALTRISEKQRFHEAASR